MNVYSGTQRERFRTDLRDEEAAIEPKKFQ
jgi:hypothetical protein